MLADHLHVFTTLAAAREFIADFDFPSLDRVSRKDWFDREFPPVEDK